jgi:hypothetical protein
MPQEFSLDGKNKGGAHDAGAAFSFGCVIRETF